MPTLLRHSGVWGGRALPVLRPQVGSPIAWRVAPHGAPARQLDLALQVEEAGILPKELLQGARARPPWQAQQTTSLTPSVRLCHARNGVKVPPWQYRCR